MPAPTRSFWSLALQWPWRLLLRATAEAPGQASPALAARRSRPQRVTALQAWAAEQRGAIEGAAQPRSGPGNAALCADGDDARAGRGLPPSVLRLVPDGPRGGQPERRQSARVPTAHSPPSQQVPARAQPTNAGIASDRALLRALRQLPMSPMAVGHALEVADDGQAPSKDAEASQGLAVDAATDPSAFTSNPVRALAAASESGDETAPPAHPRPLALTLLPKEEPSPGPGTAAARACGWWDSSFDLLCGLDVVEELPEEPRLQRIWGGWRRGGS